MKTDTHLSYLAHFFVERGNVSNKSYRGKQNTYFEFNNFFFSENRAIYEIMWENVEQEGPQMTI